MDLTKCIVVVVEDEPLISWYVRKQLEALHCGEVQFFETRQQVLEYLHHHIPDLIVTNLRLLDGWVDNSYLNFIEAKDMLILVLTGLNSQQLQPRIIQEPRFKFLYKPFTLLQFKNSLEALID